MHSFSVEHIILVGSLLLMASIVASKTSFKLGIPTLILFLAVGMLAGSEGLGGINFDDFHAAHLVGIIALNFILFSGGMDTRWDAVKPVIRQGILLSTLGVALTAIIIGLAAHLFANLSLLEGLLLGSIVSATDAAAVFSILRTRSIGLKGNIRPLLELESGSNDPMAYLLTVSITYLLTSGTNASAVSLIIRFVQEMAIGAALGYAFGKGMVWAVNRVKLEIEGLYPVLIMAMIFFTFSFTDIVGGNGFLAVYISALVLGNSNFIHKKSTIKFYDGQAWLMQIVLFLTLGLLVFPSHIVPITGIGILISLVLIFVARPIAIFICLAPFRMKTREKLFISWVGLRGAVPIVFAIYPLTAGVSNADLLFHLVFFISAISVLLQGYSLPLMAKWLKVTVPKKLKKRSPLDWELYDNIQTELVEVILPGNSPAVGKAIVKLKLPRPALIVLVVRDEKYIQPNGSTVLEEGDKLVLLASDKERLVQIYSILGV